MTTKEFQTLK